MTRADPSAEVWVSDDQWQYGWLESRRADQAGRNSPEQEVLQLHLEEYSRHFSSTCLPTRRSATRSEAAMQSGANNGQCATWKVEGAGSVADEPAPRRKDGNGSKRAQAKGVRNALAHKALEYEVREERKK